MKFKIFRCKFCAALLALCMGQVAFAADTVTEGFEDFKSSYDSSRNPVLTMPSGWDYYGSASVFSVGSTDKTEYHNARPSVCVEAVNTSSYLISPMLQGDFNFWVRNLTSKKAATVTAYTCTVVGEDIKIGSQIDTKTLATGSSTWNNISFNAPSATRVALLISQAYFDDFTFTPAEATAGPSLLVKDFANGAEFDFGTVAPGTEHTFNLINQGTEELKVTSLTVTDGFDIVSGENLTEIGPGGYAEVTVATTAKDGNGELIIVSNDENSPYKIILKSTCKVAAPVMEVSPLTLNFGIVTADASENILIKNSGDATLTVTAASDNAAFVLSQDSFNIDPDNEAILTVTFKFDADNVGAGKAVITLTPNAGETVAVVAEATIMATDPNLWEEDFEEGVIPQGWSTTGWTVEKAGSYYGNGTYMAYAGTSGNGYTLTTPRLYATEGQVLKFEVGKTTDQYDPLTVEYSHDLENWTEMEGSPVTSSGEKIFKAPSTGFYYLRFRGRYARVDNFIGFKLALKDHDLSIAGQNIPATGYQYVEYVATVSVKEMMGNAETATAALYLNGENVAETSMEIGANETKTLTLSFVPEEGMENADAYIMVTYAEAESIKGDLVSVTIAEAPVWDENEEADIEEGTIPVLVFNYTPVEGWNTISVPFALQDEYLTRIFGQSYCVYELKEYRNGIIRFHEAITKDGKYAPGYPYVVYVDGISTEIPDNEIMEADSEVRSGQILLENVKIEQPVPQSEEYNGVRFASEYSRRDVEEGETVYALNPATKKLEKADTLIGYRGYFTLSQSITSVPEVRFYDGSGQETGVGNINMETIPVEGIYNLNGIRVSEPLAPGIYIMKGKKIFVK